MSKITKLILASLVAVLVIFGVAYFAQDAYDWWRLRSYNPSAQIEKLAIDTAMSDKGKRLFYVAHPSLSDAEEFNTYCQVEELSIVLGCYISRGNIYIYDVQDARLQGVEEVTAAHEMLHVAYERLSAGEEERVNRLLQDEYEQIKDERIRETVEQYRDKDQSSVPNELHSILGTEVADLSSELEDYYAQYFDDRGRVVHYAQEYDNEFTSRQNRVEQIDKQLSSLKTEIDRDKASLSNQEAEINRQKQVLNNYRAQDQIEAYNAAVPGYNVLINQYNALVESTQQKIEHYNNLVAERNDLSVEVQGLVEAIDSTPQTID